MKRLFMTLSLLINGTWLYAVGESVGWVASTGTYTQQKLDTYANENGNYRQAVVFGDLSSSDTVRVDKITGARVSLSTSALTTSGAVVVISTAATVTQTTDSNLNASVSIKGSSNTVQLTGSIPAGSNAIGTVTATQTTDANLNASVSIKGSSNTVAATQSGTWTDTVTQTTDSNLNASVSIKGSSSTVTANQGGTWTNTVTQTTDSNLNASVSIKGSSNTVAATQSGLWSIANSTIAVMGDVAHDSVNSGNPLQLGAEAIAHGANPTAVAAADRTKLYANRHGIPFVIGGHMNLISFTTSYTAAQTDQPMVSVGAGNKIVVTRIGVRLDADTTVATGYRIGLGTANTPALGTNGVIASHPGLVPGSGANDGDGSGIIGIGADAEDLRITSDVPTTGSIQAIIAYYTIEN